MAGVPWLTHWNQNEKEGESDRERGGGCGRWWWWWRGGVTLLPLAPAVLYHQSALRTLRNLWKWECGNAGDASNLSAARFPSFQRSAAIRRALLSQLNLTCPPPHTHTRTQPRRGGPSEKPCLWVCSNGAHNNWQTDTLMCRSKSKWIQSICSMSTVWFQQLMVRDVKKSDFFVQFYSKSEENGSCQILRQMTLNENLLSRCIWRFSLNTVYRDMTFSSYCPALVQSWKKSILKADSMEMLHLQLSSKQSAHLCHVLVVVHVAVPLLPTQLPLGGADGRRARPVAWDGGQGGGGGGRRWRGGRWGQWQWLESGVPS